MTSDVIDFFMAQENGANYVVLYQMLCLKTINTEGRLSLRIGELIIPYDVGKIQRDCKWFSMDTVRVALELYKAVGLIYEDVDGTLVLSDHKQLVGSETDSAARMRGARSNHEITSGVTKGAQCAHNVTENCVTTASQEAHIVTTDIRDKRLEIRDKSLEIDTEKEREGADKPPAPPAPPKEAPHKRWTYGWVKLTDTQYSKLVQEFGRQEADRAIRYVDESAQSTGNKNRWKDWNLVVRKCIREGWGIKQYKHQQPHIQAVSGDDMERMFREAQKDN